MTSDQVISSHHVRTFLSLTSQRIYLSHLQMHHSMTHRRNSPVFLRWCRLSYPLALIHDSIISVESKAYCPCRTGPCPGNTVDQDVPAVSPAEKSAIVQILLSFCHPGALPSKFFPIQDVLQVDVLRRAHFLRACNSFEPLWLSSRTREMNDHEYSLRDTNMYGHIGRFPLGE
ncbi:unnamed protein product [Somion occarium]|uniref:Uncharacterized protein n=1 Tax=Somion occarium TaxID=3059160 RepID=A0ABP1DSH2_9APHY